LKDFFFRPLGRATLSFFEQTGQIVIFLLKTLKLALLPPYRKHLILAQIVHLGIRSLPIALTVAIFAGMVLAIQAVSQLARFAGTSRAGHVVAVSLVREIGPTLISIVVAGRVGSAIAAELGTMKVTEQIDALQAMAVNPLKYLVVPKLFACLLMFPILTIFCDVIGVVGGYCTAVYQLGMDSSIYLHSTFAFIKLKDIFVGLVKSFIFGGIVAIIGAYFGFHTEGGAEGVGKSATLAVVNAGILIIIANYLITYLFYFL
jgi:phospholipid/cholesterol/gamma-HCH transport system permease protein